MREKRKRFPRRLCLLLFAATVAVRPAPPALAAAAAHEGSLLGAWDLTITTPTGELASWIDASEGQGGFRVLMVGVSGHATRLEKVDVEGAEIRFTASKEGQGFGSDIVFQGRIAEGRLAGTASGPAGAVWRWQGIKAPAFADKKPPVWGKPVPLFNGTDLTGWKLRNESRGGTWKVVDGTLVNIGPGSDLMSASTYNDFKLHIEFKAGAASNSGIYLRGRYEVQVETDSAKEPKSHHTGGVYGFLEPNPEQPRKPDEWQSFDITLIGRSLTVIQNGVTIIAGREIPGITGGALDSHEALPGPVCLQGSEPGTVAYRNVMITPAAR